MSDFTLSLAHATLLNLSPPDLIRVAAATGYDAVGLRLISMGRPGEPRHAEDPVVLRETKRALAETGIRFLDVEVAQIREDVDPHSYVPALEASAELGARFVLANVYTPDATLAADRLAALCDLAQPLGLTVSLEPVSFSDVKTLAQTVDLVRRARRNNTAVLVDMLHFHSSKAPLSELSEVPRDLLYYVHVCDGPGDVPMAADDLRRIAREERLLPGEGGIDVAGILRHLPADLIYAVEVHNPARAAALGAEAYARLAREKTVRLLELRSSEGL